MIDGKMIFNWNVPSICGGNYQKFSEAVVDGGFEGICLKVGDGNLPFRMPSWSPWPAWGENVRMELVSALKSVGLKIYLWHFLYGGDPKGELSVAANQIKRFEPDGYIWDVETTFDGKPAAEANARLISKGLRQIYPNLEQALCWWALPKNPANYKIEWHPVRVAKAFLETVDVVMPMMYWQGESPRDAITYLGNSLSIWRTITDLPIIPVGRAYSGDGGTMNSSAIMAFADTVMDLADSFDLIGNSWWSLDKAYGNSACWSALKTTEKFGVQLTVEEIINRLVEGHPDLFPEIHRQN